MIELPSDPSTTSPWVICESGDRWAGAVRRFAPELMPRPRVATIVNFDATLRGAVMPVRSRAVILWEIHPENFSPVCDSLAAVAIEYPDTLRLAAATGLSDRRRILISELAVAATISHPEDLPSLAGMVKAYFASPGQLLD